MVAKDTGPEDRSRSSHSPVTMPSPGRGVLRHLSCAEALGWAGHHPGTQDLALAGSQEGASRESSWNLQRGAAAGLGKGLGPFEPFQPWRNAKAVGFPDPIK